MSVNVGRDINIQTGKKSNMKIDNREQKNKETFFIKVIVGVVVGLVITGLIYILNKFFGLGLRQ